MKNIKLFFLSWVFFACQTTSTDNSLDALRFNEKISATPDAKILDVRTPGEFNEGFIPNAQNIDYNSPEFESEIKDLNRDNTYFVYCLAGSRSSSAMNYMEKLGFKKVYNLKGGILDWQKNDLALTTTNPEPVKDMISLLQYRAMITSGTFVLVDYYAPWCAPCIKMKPMLDELTKIYAGSVNILRLNIDENKSLARELEVEEIPVLKIFKNGEEVWTNKGAMEKDELVAAIETAMK